MKTITYEGVQHGDWVRCVLCGAQMLLPCGADKCPECGENGTLRWVDEERQEIDAKGLDCLGYVRELRVDDYLSPTTLEEIAEEIKKKVTGITIEGAFNGCSACVEIMADDDNGVSMMHYIDYEDIIGVELIKN